MWYSRSAVVGGGSSGCPRIQAANVTPGGASHRPSARRTHNNSVSSTRRAHAAAGSPRTDGGGAVRWGSSASHAASRDDFHPVRRPCSTGEFANAPTSTGPSACTASQRPATPAPSPASTHTCTAAVEHMPLRPHGPTRSKRRSIARYRGRSSTRRAGRTGSAACGETAMPWAARRSWSTSASATTVRTRVPKGASGGLASSTWPPGSRVTVPPPGNGRAGGSRVERGRCVRPERRAQHRGIQRGGGIGGVVHQPFELHPHQPRRAVLETDRGDIALGVVLGAQHLCRLVLSSRSGRPLVVPFWVVSSPVMLRTLPPATDSFASIDGRPAGQDDEGSLHLWVPAPLRCGVDPQDTH